nr:hypothetical protein [Tanacetum cinerariifolium]
MSSHSPMGELVKRIKLQSFDDMVHNAVAQVISTPLQRLPTANQQHVGTSRTITTRPVTNETNIPIFKIFDHFRNMHPDNLQPNPMYPRDIAWNTAGQPLLIPFSRVYVWQDVKDRVIKFFVIMNFPNNGQTNRHLNYPSVRNPHVADEGHTSFSRTIVIDTDKPISSNNLGRKRKKENMAPVPTSHGIYAAADTQTLFEIFFTAIFVDGSHHSRSA